MSRKSPTVGSWFLCLSLVICVGLVPTLAEEAGKDEKEVKLTPIEKEMEMIRKLITNSQMKLRRGIIGVASSEESKDSIRTLGTMCCGENIERIDKRLETIRAIVRDRGTCFEQKWDRGGTESVTMVTQDLRSLSAGIRAFSTAIEPEDTHGALDGTLRAYLNLKRRLDVLPECTTTP